jgi:hypothetical protein
MYKKGRPGHESRRASVLVQVRLHPSKTKNNSKLPKKPELRPRVPKPEIITPNMRTAGRIQIVYPRRCSHRTILDIGNGYRWIYQHRSLFQKLSFCGPCLPFSVAAFEEDWSFSFMGGSAAVRFGWFARPPVACRRLASTTRRTSSVCC